MKDHKSLSEYNPLIKRWKKGIKKVALVYPNTYGSGIANIGLQQIYAEINLSENYLCERFYYDVEKCMRSVETGAMLRDFDILLFSIQYEEDYFKIAEIVNSLKKFRGVKIAGGPCVLENPLPLLPMFDYFYVGEVDGDVENMLNLAISGDESGCLVSSRTVLELAQTQTKLKVRKAKLSSHLETQIVGNGVYGKCYLLEVGRGCKRSCSFCVVRQIYNPCRWRDVKLLVEVAEKAKKIVDKVALISPSVTDHPFIKELIWELINMGFEVSPSSMRADTIDEEIAEMLVACNQRSVTIAPEAGSEEIRKVLRKGLSESEILNSVECVKNVGIKNVKLYYMVGIPGERREDIEAIVKLTEKVKKIGVRVTVSVNPLVPKPHTPLQFAPFGGQSDEDFKRVLKILRDKVSYLCKSFKRIGITGKIEKPENFALQTILSRGGIEVGDYLLKHSKSRILREFKTLLGELSPYEYYHWEFIDHGYNIKKLRKEYKKLVACCVS